MLGYRRGDDVLASINTARSNTTAMDDTPRRRLLVLLSVFEAAGAIAREDPKPNDAEAKWIPWDTALLESVAAIGVSGLGSGVAADLSLLSKEFHGAAQSSSLIYSPSVIGRFLGAMLTKRFSILTGLAGSGKTKLAEAFAMWLCASEQQYRIVAVGADWTSNENLLGYADALQAGKYCAPVNGALELMLRAAADPAKPYFLVLDEMNLSHVERYFADFLSAMESANSQLALHSEAADIALDSAAGATGLKVPAKLSLPKNLFIIGTVNVDETTYMFSPKVLDRANVIEFRASEADMGAFLDDPADINLDALRAQGVAFAHAFVQRAKAGADIATLLDTAGNALGPQLKVDLLEVFGALSNIGAEFGFRTAKEIARFMVIHQELSGPAWVYKDALDAQVLQKLMPKLHGSARKLSGVLKEVEAFATTKDLKLTLEKVQRMQQRLERDGFTSFAEA
jgi:5-methylcytosine-specific restriction protein B